MTRYGEGQFDVPRQRDIPTFVASQHSSRDDPVNVVVWPVMPTSFAHAAVSPPLAGKGGCERMPSHVTLGPYQLRVEVLHRSRMRDRRRRACVNVEDGRIELRDDLRGLRLVEAFLECVIRLSHFSNGCQQGCVEEAYTHSFATGMVEFVQRNPQAWIWFNLLLTEHLASDVRYDKVVLGHVPKQPVMPKRILVAGHPVTLRRISKYETGNAFGWYHGAKQEAQLYCGLTGSNLAVVALHELTHAVHHMYDLKKRDTHRAFRQAQLKGWLGIMSHNPTAWRWLAWVISFPLKATLVPNA